MFTPTHLNPVIRYHLILLIVISVIISAACSAQNDETASDKLVSGVPAATSEIEKPSTESTNETASTSTEGTKATSNETKNNQSDSANSDADDKTTEERGLEQDCGKRESVVTTFEKVTITDALGQQIDFEESPQKIATISPTATEFLYAAGGESILRDRASNYPDLAKCLPDVGSAYDPSIETIISSEPDLVIIEALTQARFIDRLNQAGLLVMAIKAESISDIKNGILHLGEIAGTQKIAQEAVVNLETRLEASKAADTRTILLLISDRDRNLYAARPESYTGLIAETAGFTNLAAGLPDSGPFPGFALMSPETILAANPDILLTITPAPEPAPRLSESLSFIPGFTQLNALKIGKKADGSYGNNVIEGDVALFLQAPGPRIVEAVELLREKTN